MYVSYAKILLTSLFHRDMVVCLLGSQNVLQYIIGARHEKTDPRVFVAWYDTGFSEFDSADTIDYKILFCHAFFW